MQSYPDESWSFGWVSFLSIFQMFRIQREKCSLEEDQGEDNCFSFKKIQMPSFDTLYILSPPASYVIIPF